MALIHTWKSAKSRNFPLTFRDFLHVLLTFFSLFAYMNAEWMNVPFLILQIFAEFCEKIAESSHTLAHWLNKLDKKYCSCDIKENEDSVFADIRICFWSCHGKSK